MISLARRLKYRLLPVIDVSIQRTEILLQKCYTYMPQYVVTSQVFPRYFQTHK